MASVRLAANPDRLTRYTVEKTAREAIPGFFSYVILWSFLMGFGGALSGTAFGLFLCYAVTYHLTVGGLPLDSEVALYTRFFSLAFFGLFFVTALRRQMKQWEGMITEFEEQEYQPREQTQPIIRPMPQPQQRRSNTIVPMKPGTYPKTQVEMAEVYHALVSNNWRFVRDDVNVKSPRGGNVFPNITANWDGILSEWQRLGYVDNSQNVTDDGRYWIESQCPPGTVTD